MVNRKKGCHKLQVMLHFGSKIPRSIKKQKRNTARQIAQHRDSKSRIPIPIKDQVIHCNVVKSEYSLSILDNASKADLFSHGVHMRTVSTADVTIGERREQHEVVISREEISEHTLVPHPPPSRDMVSRKASFENSSVTSFHNEELKNDDANGLVPLPPAVKSQRSSTSFRHRGRTLIKKASQPSGQHLPPAKSRDAVEVQPEEPAGKKKSFLPPIRSHRNSYDERKPVRVRGKNKVLDIAAPEAVVSHNDRQLRRQVYGKQVYEQSRTQLPKISDMGEVRPRGQRKPKSRDKVETESLPQIFGLDEQLGEVRPGVQRKPKSRDKVETESLPQIFGLDEQPDTLKSEPSRTKRATRWNDEDRLPSESQMSVVKPSRCRLIIQNIDEEDEVDVKRRSNIRVLDSPEEDYKQLPSPSPSPPSRPKPKKMYIRQSFNYSSHALAKSHACGELRKGNVPMSQHALETVPEESFIPEKETLRSSCVHSDIRGEFTTEDHDDKPWFLKPLSKREIMELVEPYERQLAAEEMNKSDKSPKAWFVDFRTM